MLKVQLLFASRQKSDSDLRLAFKSDWLFDVGRPPQFSVGMILRKLRILPTEFDLSKLILMDSNTSIDPEITAIIDSFLVVGLK